MGDERDLAEVTTPAGSAGGDALIRGVACVIQLLRAWEQHGGASAHFEAVAEAWGIPTELAHAMFAPADTGDPLAGLVAARDAPEQARLAQEREDEKRARSQEAASRPFGTLAPAGERTTW